jgi:hypothetical protein
MVALGAVMALRFLPGGRPAPAPAVAIDLDEPDLLVPADIAELALEVDV